MISIQNYAAKKLQLAWRSKEARAAITKARAASLLQRWVRRSLQASVAQELIYDWRHFAHNY